MVRSVRVRRHGRRRTIATWLTASVALLLPAVAVAPAQADFGVESFSTTFHTPAPYVPEWFSFSGNLPAPLTSVTQAGGHPDLTTEFTLGTIINRDRNEALEPVKDVELNFPAGFYGNPQVAPTCSPAQAYNGAAFFHCPTDTQVGMAYIMAGVGGTRDPTTWTPAPVFNLAPTPDEAAAFVFAIAGTIQSDVRISVRTEGDYGLRAIVRNVPQQSNLSGFRMTLWGVPADPAEDPDRWDATGVNGVPSPLPRRPFLTAPANCSAPLTSEVRVRSWYHPDRWVSTTTSVPQPTGCDALDFNAGLQLRPQHARPGEPAGYDIDLSVQQNDDPDGLSTPTVRKVDVKLPEGVGISPPSAMGLDGCSDAGAMLGSAEDVRCPETSKIGSVSISTPVLADPLVGDVYLRSPQPGNLFRLLIVARGAGMVIKLPGTVSPDKVTGQITAVFDNTPQLPFDHLAMSLRGGARAPLVNPATCGTKTTTAEVTAHTGAVVRSSSSFAIEGCGPDVFAPTFHAGVQNAIAGKSSAFTLTVGRDGGPQVLRSLQVRMPKGLLAHIGDVPLCDEGRAAAGSCDEGSRVGSVTVGAGAGSAPFYLPGKVYMGGAYKGAPYSLSIVVPAIAGPFDLGTVVVRAAVHIDQKDTSLMVDSDPIPTILEGVPLNLRALNVTMDRSQFMVNPTNCTRMAVDGHIASQTGTDVARSARFQLADCGSLPFRPRLRLHVGNARRVPRAGQTTPLEATLRMTPGQANNRVVRVKLPRTMSARLEVLNIRRSCSMEQYDAERCPMTIGTAVATTPLLQDPLRGGVYLVRNPARRLPDMMVKLKGQGTASLVEVDLTGKITIPRDLTLATTFDTVPDVPISMFSLRLAAGQRGALVANKNLCDSSARRASVASLAFTAQSGKRVTRNERVRVVGCGKKAKTAKRSSAANRK